MTARVHVVDFGPDSMNLRGCARVASPRTTAAGTPCTARMTNGTPGLPVSHIHATAAHPTMAQIAARVARHKGVGRRGLGVTHHAAYSIPAISAGPNPMPNTSGSVMMSHA